MRLFNYVVEARLSARHPWTHLKNHRHETYRHLVWGRLSVIYGQPHLTPMRVCSECSEEIQAVSAGDESWDWCESCQQVEGDTETITLEEYEAIHG
jgi:formamidopyrimidine-DNA glycosylase